MKQHVWGKRALMLALTLGTGSCDVYFGANDVPGDVPPECLPEPDDTVESFPLQLGPTTKAEDPPPAISGGTVAISPDETTVVAADPDRDKVYIVSLTQQALLSTIVLDKHDEPGRVTFDASNRAYVSLRKSGAIAVIDVAAGTLLARHDTCKAPRGLDYDELTNQLYVACSGGELVIMDPGTGQIISEQRVDKGLRDVIIDATHVYVTKFRTAEVIVLDRTGRELERMQPPVVELSSFDFETGEERTSRFEPNAAWRAVPDPAGGIVLLHQRARRGKVEISRGGYGGDCGGGIVHAAITPIRVGVEPPGTMPLNGAVLPVDIALDSAAQMGTVVSAGNGTPEFPLFSPVSRVPLQMPARPFECLFGEDFEAWSGQPISVDATSTDTVVVQFREPAFLSIFPNGSMWGPVNITLDQESRADTGHTMFHMNSGGNVACASCHLEGGDDGRVWEFNCIGPRRTQSLQFGILGTEPFHWDGDMNNLDKLMGEVFVGRMSGGVPNPDQIEAMGQWMNTISAPPRSLPANPTAVERGKQLFDSAEVGCATCHSGPKLTNNRSYDVGTGGTFQVPSLINIGDRAPFIHTGCAPTLRDRFTNPNCGGGDEHGVVSHLSASQIDDLIAYLETL